MQGDACSLPTDFLSLSDPTHLYGSPGPMGVGTGGRVLENIGLVQPASSSGGITDPSACMGGQS